jgi:hypothetical protein
MRIAVGVTLCVCQALFGCSSGGGGATSSPSTTGGDGGDACLAFTMPANDVLFGSARKVFAHYFYPFPLSIDNRPSAQDYYNTQYLTTTGENDKWVAQGGYLRQRPLSVPVGSSASWPLLNMEAEVRMAIARGITGFTVDVLSLDASSAPNGQLYLMLQAAQAVDPRFKIVVMPDIDALGSDVSAVEQIIASVASSPSAYRLSDGRLVVTAFDASQNSPGWWAGVIDQLSAQGINVAFVPTFLGWKAQASAFDNLSYGFADWGTATPAESSAMQTDPALAHTTYGKLYMMPVDPQQFRPKTFVYWEAGNSAAFRDAWMSAIQGEADWVQLVTWSDFSESGEVEPFTDATLSNSIGTGFYDLNGYYASWFLSGQQPAITHDVLYYFYRRESTSGASPAQSQPDNITASTPENDIELLAFLTAPGILEITIGGQTYSQDAPAGISSFKIPLQPGLPVFTLGRNGAEVLTLQGGVQIYGESGIPSGAQDLTYWTGSASQRGICGISTQTAN